jgi:hypothetical protein
MAAGVGVGGRLLKRQVNVIMSAQRARHCGMPYFELGEGGEITWSDRAGPGVLTNLDLEPTY